MAWTTLSRNRDVVRFLVQQPSGMSMWPRALVGGGKLDELCHRVCALGDWGAGGALSIGDLGVACDHHAFHAKYVIALVVGHLGAARWGQLSRMCQGSNRIKASTAADHALGAGAAYPITKPSRSLSTSGCRKKSSPSTPSRRHAS
jgi:hypothetical protein